MSTMAKPNGGDNKNYYTFHTGYDNPHNSMGNVADWAREHFSNMKDMSDSEIMDKHIYWAKDGASFKGKYGHESYVLFDDADKLPDDIKADAIKYCELDNQKQDTTAYKTDNVTPAEDKKVDDLAVVEDVDLSYTPEQISEIANRSYLSDETKKYLAEASEYGIVGFINKAKAVPKCVKAALEFTENEGASVGGITAMSSAMIDQTKGNLNHVQMTSAFAKANKSFKNDIKDLSKTEKMAAFAEFSSYVIDRSMTNIKERSKSTEKTTSEISKSIEQVKQFTSKPREIPDIDIKVVPEGDFQPGC